jgi:hypothetical protein
MFCTLSPGDVIRFGDSVVLTVMAVEGAVVRFALVSTDGGPLDVGLMSRSPDPEENQPTPA